MTRIRYVQRKVDDLRTGNMYVHFARDPEEHYGPPARIIGIQKRKDKLKIITDDYAVRLFNPEHVVIVQELA